MARLIAYINLLKIDETFVGVSKDADDKRVICTYSKNMVYVMEIRNLRQSKVWTFERSPFLTSRVMFDFKLKKYVGIFGGSIMKMWDEDIKEVAKAKKTALYRDVADLVQSDDGRVLILYKNSFCESVESALNAPKDRSPERENREIALEDVHQVEIGSCEGVGRHLTFFTRGTKKRTLELNFVQLQEEDLLPNGVFKRMKVTMERKVKGYCVLEMHRKLHLLIFCADGRLFRHPFLDEDADEKIEAIFTLNTVNPEKKLAMTAISSDLLAMYGASNVDGASLFLFNTEYKVIQSKQHFKMFCEKSRVCSFDSNVFLLAGTNLSVIPFRVMRDKLADLIGSQRPDLITRVQLENFDGTDIYIDDMAFDEAGILLEQITCFRQKKYLEVNMPQSVVAVTEDMRKLLRNQVNLEAVETPDAASPELQIKPNPYDCERLPLITEILLCELESQGANELEIVDKIVPILIGSNQNPALVTVLRRFLNISEKVLTVILRHALTVKDFNLVNAVVACNFDPNTLIPQLRTLSFPEVKDVLRHFFSIYKNPNVELGNKFESADSFDTDARILAWSSTLIDANYQQIVLTKDPEMLKMVQDWRKIVKEQERGTAELEILKEIMHEMYRGRHGKSTKTNQWYSIEKVEL